MPLPFKEERPSLPNSKVLAEQKLKCLEKHLKRDEQYHKDYVAFKEDMIAREDAEKVPEIEINNNQRIRYISHQSEFPRIPKSQERFVLYLIAQQSFTEFL